MQEMLKMRLQFLGWEDLLEEEMAIYSTILDWKIPWTGVLVGYSPWDRRVRHNWVTEHAWTTHSHHGAESCRNRAPKGWSNGISDDPWGGWQGMRMMGHGTLKTKDEFAASGWCGSSSISKQWFSPAPSLSWNWGTTSNNLHPLHWQPFSLSTDSLLDITNILKIIGM